MQFRDGYGIGIVEEGSAGETGNDQGHVVVGGSRGIPLAEGVGNRLDHLRGFPVALLDQQLGEAILPVSPGEPSSTIPIP